MSRDLVARYYLIWTEEQRVIIFGLFHQSVLRTFWNQVSLMDKIFDIWWEDVEGPTHPLHIRHYYSQKGHWKELWRGSDAQGGAPSLFSRHTQSQCEWGGGIPPCHRAVLPLPLFILHAEPVRDFANQGSCRIGVFAFYSHSLLLPIIFKGLFPMNIPPYPVSSLTYENGVLELLLIHASLRIFCVSLSLEILKHYLF